MEEVPSGQRGQTVNLLALPSVVRIHLPPFSNLIGYQYRGVEQLVARRAHNPKVVGSSPSSATQRFACNDELQVFLLLKLRRSAMHPSLTLKKRIAAEIASYDGQMAVVYSVILVSEWIFLFVMWQ